MERVKGNMIIIGEQQELSYKINQWHVFFDFYRPKLSRHDQTMSPRVLLL